MVSVGIPLTDSSCRQKTPTPEIAIIALGQAGVHVQKMREFMHAMAPLAPINHNENFAAA
jgi:hypothetical protein